MQQHLFSGADVVIQNEEKHFSYDLFNMSPTHINLAAVIGGYRRDGLAMAVLQGWVLWVLPACVCAVGEELIYYSLRWWMDSISRPPDWIKKTAWFIYCSSHCQLNRQTQISHFYMCNPLPAIVVWSHFIWERGSKQAVGLKQYFKSWKGTCLLPLAPVIIWRARVILFF